MLANMLGEKERQFFAHQNISLKEAQRYVNANLKTISDMIAEQGVKIEGVSAELVADPDDGVQTLDVYAEVRISGELASQVDWELSKAPFLDFSDTVKDRIFISMDLLPD